MSDSTSPPQASPEFHLALHDANALFTAPAANPFATDACEILGCTGVDYLHARVKAHWPRPPRFTQIILQLPAVTVPSEPAALEQVATQMQTALQRYCAEKETAVRDARKLTVRMALRQTLWAMLLTLCAVGFAVAVANGWPAILPPFMRGVLAIVFLLAASLAIWDALDALLFQWAPFAIDSRAYRTLARMQIVIEPNPPRQN